MKQLLLLLLGTLLASEAFAVNLLDRSEPNTFTYNYIEGEYVDIDEVNADGFRFSGSYSAAQNFSVIASWLIAEGDSDSDFTRISLGAAYHQKLQGTELKHADFIFHLSIEKQELEIGSFKDDDTGIFLGGGLRSRLNDVAELFGDLGYRTTGENDFVVKLGTRFKFTDNFQGIASLEFSDSDILAIGARYNF